MSTLAALPAALAPRPIAPARHTVVLIALFLAMALSGALAQHHAAAQGRDLPAAPNVAYVYLPLIAIEWALALTIVRSALRPSGIAIATFVGLRPAPRDVALDVVLGAATWGTWKLLERGMGLAFPEPHAASVRPLLPHGALAIGLWAALALSAGVCEELAFRGYFLRQFHAWTRRPIVALLLQALLFGVAHGYQGVSACARITVYGLLMGIVARGRGSLLPVMVAHAWTDLAAGIFGV